VASHKLEGRATQAPVSDHSVEDRIGEKWYQRYQDRLEKQQQGQEEQEKMFLRLLREQEEMFLQLLKEEQERVLQLRKERQERHFPCLKEAEERCLQLRREEQQKHYAQRMKLHNTIAKQSKRDGALTVKFLHSLFVFSF